MQFRLTDSALYKGAVSRVLILPAEPAGRVKHKKFSQAQANTAGCSSGEDTGEIETAVLAETVQSEI